MRYLDSGSRDPEQTLQHWLEQSLVDADFFACQSGFFSRDALDAVATALTAVLDKGGEVHLVVGSNNASTRSDDLLAVLDLFEPYGHLASLTLLAAYDVAMHPKTYYVEAAGVRRALVTSANFTGRGLAANVEAGLAVDSVNDRTAPFAQMRAAILAWHSAPSNACRVTRGSLAGLVRDGVIDRSVPGRLSEPARRLTRRRRRFPKLGRLAGRIESPRGGPAAVPLPGGAIGIVMVLTGADTAGFRQLQGRTYVGLPAALCRLLAVPSLDAAQDAEPPQTPVEVLARLNTSPERLTSGRAPARITWAPTARLHYLDPIRLGVRYAAACAGVDVPRVGDLLAIELLLGDVVRLTWVTDIRLKESLRPHATGGGARWGWLPPGVLPTW